MVTNALNIANDLAVRRTIKLVVTGGVARPEFVRADRSAGRTGAGQRLHLDYVVLGVDGFEVATGATAHHEGEAAVNAMMVAQATTVVVVADASKLGPPLVRPDLPDRRGRRADHRHRRRRGPGRRVRRRPTSSVIQA